MSRLLTVAGILVVVFVASEALAKDSLITDRPDFTESAFVVGRGTVQLDIRAARRFGSEGVDLLLPKLSDSHRRSAPTPCALGVCKKLRHTTSIPAFFYKRQSIKELAHLIRQNRSV